MDRAGVVEDMKSAGTVENIERAGPPPGADGCNCFLAFGRLQWEQSLYTGRTLCDIRT